MPRLVPPVVPAGRMATRKQPTLTGGVASLRPWGDADVDAVVGAFDEDSIQQWHMRRLDQVEAGIWITDWHKAWKEESAASWAIIAADPLPALGQVGLRQVDLRFGYAEISYWVREAVRRRGLATEGVQLAADWALTDLGLHRLEIRHSVHNQPSCLVALRAGFEHEGTARSSLLHHDGWHDMHIHGRFGT
jgi:[ribosomal protein S5]-alanine N-acetyltransferase